MSRRKEFRKHDDVMTKRRLNYMNSAIIERYNGFVFVYFQRLGAVFVCFTNYKIYVRCAHIIHEKALNI